jgi:hypothetical protein
MLIRCHRTKCLVNITEKINISTFLFIHVRWVRHHGMARPQVVDVGDTLQVWREVVNILNKQSQMADKGWSSSLGVGRGANDSSL